MKRSWKIVQINKNITNRIIYSTITLLHRRTCRVCLLTNRNITCRSSIHKYNALQSSFLSHPILLTTLQISYNSFTLSFISHYPSIDQPALRSLAISSTQGCKARRNTREREREIGKLLTLPPEIVEETYQIHFSLRKAQINTRQMQNKMVFSKNRLNQNKIKIKQKAS